MYHILLHTPPYDTPNHEIEVESLQQYRQGLEDWLPFVRTNPSILQAYSNQQQTTRLVALDLDGTLTQAEFMQELASHLPQPLQDNLYKLTQYAVEGTSINWESNFIQRVNLLQGLPESTALTIAQNIPLAPNAKEFIQALHERGISTAIITGAYQGIAHSVARQLGIQHVYCSQFQVQHHKFTGHIIPPILTPLGKATALQNLLHQLQISPQECTAIGDSFNDLPMLTLAGQALLYHAKQPAPLPLTDLLPFI